MEQDMVQRVDEVRTKAHTTAEVTALEKRNRQVSLEAAEEAIVLLENNGVLPLRPGSKVAMFGEGVTNTVKGGSGSGEVNERHSVSIYEGMIAGGFQITTESLLQAYERRARTAKEQYYKEQQDKAGLLNFQVSMSCMMQPYVAPPFPALTEDDLNEEAAVGIYVISRISGEGYDRKLEKGDYYLSDIEVDNIRLCRAHYPHLILVINAGGPVDFSEANVTFDAVLFMAMLGTAGGCALANVLSGKVNPSGHLTDTWAKRYEDIPYGMEYSYLNGNVEKEYYREGIYVGYRYFDTFHVTPQYSFGHGLSYTDYTIDTGISLEGDQVRISAKVTNYGTRPGKEVVQVYVSCPGGRLQKEHQRLVGFSKTAIIPENREAEVEITFPLVAMASYEEVSGCRLLEPGEYIVRVGDSSANTRVVAVLRLEREVVVSRHDHICPRTQPLEELTQDYITTEQQSKWEEDVVELVIDPDSIETIVYQYSDPEEYHDTEVDHMMAQLTLHEAVDLCVGCGNDMVVPMSHYYTTPGATGYSTNKYFGRGIYDISFCDGPAGIRFQQQSVAIKGQNKVKGITASIELLNFLPSLVRRLCFGKASDGTVLYQYATAFPVGVALAQTWNPGLVERVGRAANAELEEYGITFWLAPGMNIHRNPLCGRNYEYYSEDPLLTGKIAAAMTRGVQSDGNHSVSLKHFLCNNQETNRGDVSSEVSERALREIYLLGFEIAVKEGGARGVMTSYNRVNGVFSAVNHDAVTKVLRNEWGFDGLVMTDWDGWKRDCDADRSMYAGVDILMQGDGRQKRQIRRALKNGTLPVRYVRRSASHVLRMISRVKW